MTEIREMPEEWGVVRLGNVCAKMKSGGTPLTSKKEFYGGDIKFVKIEDLTNSNKYLTDTITTITEKGLENSNAWLVPENSVLIGIYGSLGATALNKVQVATNQAILGIIPDEKKLNEEYLYYFFLNSKNLFLRQAKHTTQANLTLQIIDKLQIPLPPLIEQRRIVEVLGTVDSAIQKVGGAIESTERLKKGLMQRLLTRGIGHERFKFCKELGYEIPEEWEVKAVGDIAETSSGGTPSRDKKEYFGGNIPWVKSGELKDNTIYSTEEKITEKGLQNSSAKLFPKGTLLIALYGATVGKTGILGIDATTNQAICGILGKNGLIDQKFLQYYLFFRRKQLISLSSGGAQPNISQEIIRVLKFAYPPLPEQRRISEILGAADRKLELERRRKEKLEKVKKGLMNELLTGRKRVKVK